MECKNTVVRRAAIVLAPPQDWIAFYYCTRAPDGFMLFQSIRNDAGVIIDFEWI
jgi:hypothetical protein